MKRIEVLIPKNKQVWIITILAFLFSMFSVLMTLLFLLGGVTVVEIIASGTFATEPSVISLFSPYVIHLTVFFVLLWSLGFLSKYVNLKKWYVFLFVLLIAILGAMFLRLVMNIAEKSGVRERYPCDIVDNDHEVVSVILSPGSPVVDLLPDYDNGQIKNLSIYVPYSSDYRSTQNFTYKDVDLKNAPDVVREANELHAKELGVSVEKFRIANVSFQASPRIANEIARNSNADCYVYEPTEWDL